MECNIGQDAVFLTHSETLHYLGIFIKEDKKKYRQILHFYFTKKFTYNICYYIIIININYRNICPKSFQNNY